MSKAFTSEETEDASPIGRAPPRAGESRPITRSGKAALEAELRAIGQERRELETRPRGSAIEVAARKEELLRREELLDAVLATAIEVSTPTDPDEVVFGCAVEVVDERGKKHRYQLVGPDETDARAGKISVASPLGRALLGQRVGDEIELELPRGSELYTIKKIS